MTKLSDTQLVLLSTAAKRDDGVLTRPAKSHPPALAKALQNLLSLGLIRREPATPSIAAWGDDQDGNRYALRITKEGLEAIGVEPDAEPSKEREPTKQPRSNSKRAAPNAGSEPTPDAITAPAAAIGSPTAEAPARTTKQRAAKSARPATPTVQSQRPGSKLATVVDMLRAPDGVSLAAIMKATDWRAHSVRGAIAGAIKKKLGLTVVSERRGDERFYRIAG